MDPRMIVQSRCLFKRLMLPYLILFLLYIWSKCTACIVKLSSGFNYGNCARSSSTYAYMYILMSSFRCRITALAKVLTRFAQCILFRNWSTNYYKLFTKKSYKLHLFINYYNHLQMRNYLIELQISFVVN